MNYDRQLAIRVHQSSESSPFADTRDSQATMLAFVDLEERVPKDHPLRIIKAVADEALERLSAEFDGMYSKVGRASVPPERLLKASLLITLYSVAQRASLLRGAGV